MIRETDLFILADRDYTEQARERTLHLRNQIERYIDSHPRFASSLVPLPFDPAAPPIVKAMLQAGTAAEVGPMAAVAGAIAEFVGKDLIKQGATEVLVENGGDIFIHRKQDSVASIFAGDSPLSGKIGIFIAKEHMPLGVCTSSGSVGHSLSFGSVDSATVLAPSTALADAFATRLGNEVRTCGDIDQALTFARTLVGITGVVMVKDGRLGAWGDIELVPLQ